MSNGSTSWYIKGQEFIHCNCAYGCPCQFNALPTHGDCKAVLSVAIQEGKHGDTDLSGLNMAAIVAWPGAVHEGGGHIVPIVDERAGRQQREALLRIMCGQDTVPGTTVFLVFSTTYAKVHDPVFAPIKLAIDIDGRSATLEVPGWIDARGEPIRNPVTGEETRARINLPNGFEYDVAEQGRGWAKTSGPVDVQLEDSHAHFAMLDMNERGVVHP
jgi:hypothetical protein